MSENTIAIIPARYGSTRFPGKPLADIAGKTMIRRVYEQVAAVACIREVIVATDDERIIKQVESFGGKAVMTNPSHHNGTERCAEVLEKLSPKPRLVICVQGDEPFIASSHIELLVKSLGHPHTRIATLIKAISDPEELVNPHIPKVVMDRHGEALYFSRSTIPFLRGIPEKDWLGAHPFYKHIGIYGYLADTLKAIAKLPETALEKSEQLEQLRWLENGYRIRLEITDQENFAVDTPQDLERLLQKIRLSETNPS